MAKDQQHHAVLDLGEDDLQFTETDYNSQRRTEYPSPTHSEDRDTARLLEDEQPQVGTSKFWTMGFYQQFFDVDTREVKTRLLYSMVPIPGKSFLQHHIRPKPDLYGPFWICLTLVFSIAVSGNIASYLQSDGQARWHYDFHKVTLAATAVFSYASLLPASLYGYLWYTGSGSGSATLSFLELVCLYGYSLAIYIPVSVLWLIQVTWLQWLLVMTGAGLSGAVLMMTIWPAVRDQASKSAMIVMVVVLALHLLLACGFMLYFFHVPSGGAGPAAVTSVKPDNVEGDQAAENKDSPTEDKALSSSSEGKKKKKTKEKGGGGNDKENPDANEDKEKADEEKKEENNTVKRKVAEEDDEEKSINAAGNVEDKTGDDENVESVDENVEGGNESVVDKTKEEENNNDQPVGNLNGEDADSPNDKNNLISENFAKQNIETKNEQETEERRKN